MKQNNLIIKDTSNIQEEYFIDYSFEYMINRAVPFIEDGLKPIHRRILYTMYNVNKIVSTDIKSASIVGDIMKIHPHGDSAIYDAYVNLSQPWKTPYPLIEIHGNKGSIDGDPAAASRYTLGKVSKYGVILAQSLNQINDKNIWKDTELQDGNQEPIFFPTILPNLLINGSSGISLKKVNIPPFNLKEICELCIDIAKNKKIKTQILYPDFGDSGGFFKNPLKVYAETIEWENIMKMGDGSFTIYANIENDPIGLSIKSIPWTITGDMIINDLVQLTDSSNPKKYIPDILDIHRLSSKENGFLIKIALKRNADKEHIKQLLYKNTHLMITYRAILNIVNNGYVSKLGIIDICKQSVINSKKYITQMYEKLIKDEEAELNILEGLLHLRDVLDKVIKLVRASKNRDEVIVGLIKMKFNEAQANYIADLKLHKLSKDNSDAWLKRKAELLKLIKEQTAIIKDDKLLTNDYISRMQGYIKEFARNRFTEVLDHDLAIDNIESKEGQKQLALLKKNVDNSIYFDKDGKISYNEINTKWKFSDDIDLIVVNKKLEYYNYHAHNNINDLSLVFKDNKLKLLTVFKYDENKDIIIVTSNKIKRIALKDLKDRIKPDELISNATKLINFFIVNKDEDKIIVGSSKDGSLAFKIDEIPYQVKGSGVAFAKQDIEKCELVKSYKDIRHRGYTLK